MSNFQVMCVFCVIWQAALPPQYFILWLNIRIDHDVVCVGVVRTAMPNSASCAGRLGPLAAGTTSALPDFSTNYNTTKHISGQILFYHDHNFTKSKGNLCFRRLVPLFVPIGVCVTTHDDGTASDVTIGLWRHNQQATNYERKGKPRFSFPMYLSHVIFKWWYAIEWMMIRKYVQVMPWIQKKLHIGKSKGHKNFEAMRFCFGHVSLVVTFARRLPEVCLKCNECNFGDIWCCATLFPSVHFVDAEIHDGFSDGVLETFTQAFQKFPN